MDIRETIRNYSFWVNGSPPDTLSIIDRRTSQQTVELLAEELCTTETWESAQNILALIEDILKARNGVSSRYAKNFSTHLALSLRFYQYLETHIITEQRLIQRPFLSRFSYLTASHLPILRTALAFAKVWDPFCVPNLLREIERLSDEVIDWNTVTSFMGSHDYLHRWAILAYFQEGSGLLSTTHPASKIFGIVEALCHDSHLLVATEAKLFFAQLKLEQHYETNRPTTKKGQKRYAKRLSPYRNALDDAQPAYSFEFVGYAYFGFLTANEDLRSSPEMIDAFLSYYWKKPLHTISDFVSMRENIERFLDNTQGGMIKKIRNTEEGN